MIDQIVTENCVYLLGPKPKATLIEATPEWVVAQAVKGYTGVYNNEAMSIDEQHAFWDELGSTKLKGPLEMAQTFWLIEDVTRAFTHQLARYRIGTSMVQESQRFSKQSAGKARIMVPVNTVRGLSTLEEAVAPVSLESFIDTCELMMQEYHTRVAAGGDIQDARAILPTHICTRLYLSVNVASLAHIYNQRQCCQAQHGEWTDITVQMRSQLDANGYQHYAGTLQAPWEDPNCITCGFGANFDRPCQFKEKFEQNLINAFFQLPTKE